MIMSSQKMKYPIGIQSFKSLRENNYAYVDKTAYVYRLVNSGKYYFLSRPRRFGKSLLLSTMKAYFLGQRELFQGLYMEQVETAWDEFPVLYLDFNNNKFTTEDAVEVHLNNALCQWEELYGSRPSELTLSLRFGGVIKRAHEKTGKPVVILVDEYDKPLLATIGNAELQANYRATLKAFYSNLKNMDEHIKFAFLTGVTKFGKISVFSDLNNLNDISLDGNYSGVCGITEAELTQYFSSSIEELAEANGVGYEEMRSQLKKQFDGYRFSRIKADDVYNPFSIINTFYRMELGDYWFETGTPTFLVELLKRSNYDLRLLQHEELTSDMMMGVDTIDDNPIPIIYQSGYLTIKDYDPQFRFYTLGFPNEEVGRGFTQFLLAAYTPLQTKSAFFIRKFVEDIQSGRPEDFMRRLETFFAGGNYQIAGDAEKYFQNCLFLLFKMLGFYVHAEYPTAEGRSDILVETPDYVYIIETKLDGSAEEALAQIDDRGYARPYALDKRKLYKIGVNFSSQTRGVEKWVMG